MKFCLVFLFPLILFYCISCKQKAAQQASKETKDTTPFFPVLDYLKEQIKQVDSTPYFMYRIKIINGKKDSLPITTKQFDSLVQPFIDYDISADSVKQKYASSVFEDRTMQNITLSYRAKDSTLNLQSADVLLNEDGNKVQRIFMNIFKNNGDTSVIEKLGWKANENCYINRVYQLKNGSEITEQNIIFWK